jgi:hypothetical protein
VTSVIAGALVGLALSASSPLSVPVVTVFGSALFGVTWLDQERRWRRSARSEPTRLPGGRLARTCRRAGRRASPAPTSVPAVT